MAAEMYVMATAGHVDHGKSTLVRALTGMEPDRWAEERRRGLTIDLGFAWTTLDSGREVAFVDVPGHERFLGNMLAGLGPAPAVCFVVAADEGWQAQSSDHRDAIAAWGINRGVIVLTRIDRAPGRAAEVLAQARMELGQSGLRDAPAVAVSAVDGTGLDGLRSILDETLASIPEPEAAARVRLWIDRSFTIAGTGTVVTGTLTAGTLARGDRLRLLGRDGVRQVSVRALHSRNEAVAFARPTSRIAVNVRVPADTVHRGDVLLSGDSWPVVDTVDVRRTTGSSFAGASTHLLVHVGTAAVRCRMRPFDGDHARLALDRPLPLELGDRVVLRVEGSQRILAGAQILDVDPPALHRRGDSARRSGALAAMQPGGDALVEVIRRGAVRVEELRRVGVSSLDRVPDGVRDFGGWWVHEPVLDGWSRRLRGAVQQLDERDPLAEGLSRGAARDLLGPPGDALLDIVIQEAGLEHGGGFIAIPGRRKDLGAAEAGISTLEHRLAQTPFAAPEAQELGALGLGTRELAAAERSGRVLRLADGIVLLPKAPALAMRTLASLRQPFTTSEARQALGTTRRVAIPLLEHLDGRGWTRRLDAGRRTIVRAGPA